MFRNSCIVLMTLVLHFGSGFAFGADAQRDWQLTDIQGTLHKPFDDQSTRGIVFVFVSTDCPIANSYQPLLRRLAEQYAGDGVRFFQVHPKSTTTVEAAREHALQFGIKSPVLVDAEQLLAKRVGATMTPEVVVYLKGDETPVYRGRIDNLYAGYGKKRKIATSNDLADVLGRIAEESPITPTVTSPIGCHISFDDQEPANHAEANAIAERIGYEILQIKSLNEIIVWASKDITRAEFDAIHLPLGWFKNQPREIETDRARFLHSPGLKEGEFQRAEHFGHRWLHVATVKQVGKRIDSDGQLLESKVNKAHVATFEEGRTVTLLVSPEGNVFPRITRDVDRKSDNPLLPKNWRLKECKLERPLEVRLPDITTVIRTDNQDSFQGPLSFTLQDLFRSHVTSPSFGEAGGSELRE